MSEPTAEPHLVFVTDPMCAWCWGMWPEIERLRAHVEGLADIDLLMGGMQIGQFLEPPTAAERQRIEGVWQEVGRVTGQSFTDQLPADPAFFYHSEIPCRAVTAMRWLLGRPPFGFLERLHAAFYVEARNPRSSAVLAELAAASGVDAEAFLARLGSEEVDHATREGFRIARSIAGGVLPSIVGIRNARHRLLVAGYASFEQMLPTVDAWLAPPISSEVH